MNASRAALWTAVVATTLVVMATVAHGWSVAVNDPSIGPLTPMKIVERGDDYVAWTEIHAPRSHVSVHYAAFEGAPDRILLLRQGDLSTLLAGGTPTTLAEFSSLAQGQVTGRFSFDPPDAVCPPPTGGCLPESIPVLVWIAGDGWKGARVEEASNYLVTTQAWDGPPITNERTDGPVRPAIAHTHREVVHNAPRVLALAAIGGGVGLLAMLAHVVLELKRPADERLVPRGPRLESTETMIALARMTTLYVAAIRRSFVVSLAAILGITAAVLFLGLPPMLERVSAQFLFLWELQEQHVALYILAPLYVAAIVLARWAIAYARVRRELNEWRRRARGLDDEAARVLGA